MAPSGFQGALPTGTSAPERISTLFFIYIGVDDSGNVIFVLVDLFEKTIVFVVVQIVFKIFFVIIVVFVGDRDARTCGVILVVVLVVDFFFDLVDILVGIGLVDFLVFGLLRFFVLRIVLLGGLPGWDGRLRRTAALTEKYLRLKCEGAFGTFDGSLLEIVKTRAATGADTFRAEIRFDQGLCFLRNNKWSEGRWVCHDREDLSKLPPVNRRAPRHFPRTRHGE